MTMDHARTCWAEGYGLPDEAIEVLTEIAEEADRRVAGIDLATGDLSEWRLRLEEAGLSDLAERVREDGLMREECAEEATTTVRILGHDGSEYPPEDVRLTDD